ncbi:MAG: hypothetical protein KGK10_03995 [Rhodospirillales bacterium]|nr:hypothetical protein [Rhodospirillales bacterium]
MTRMIAMPAGFAYLAAGPRPFSAGVIARPGHRLVRVRPRNALSLADGLGLAASHLAARGLPALALAALELRAPAALAPEAFAAFNRDYANLLRERGFLAGDTFPIARSNMAPLFDPPRQTLLHAFTYAAPAASLPGGGPEGAADFLVSGKPELSEDPPGIVAAGDTSAAGMHAKAHFVVAALRATTDALGGDWSLLTGAQAYTPHPLEGARAVLRASGLADLGVTLVPGYPPVTGLDFELDVRAISAELAA